MQFPARSVPRFLHGRAFVLVQVAGVVRLDVYTATGRLEYADSVLQTSAFGTLRWRG